MGMKWTCPTCGKPTTIVSSNLDVDKINFYTSESGAGEGIQVKGTLIKCPDPLCGAQKFSLSMRYTDEGGAFLSAPIERYVSARKVGIGDLTIIPTTPRPLSAYSSTGVVSDFNEAWLILELSPKAAATLARRALQGMIRHRWEISLPTLHSELVAIKDRCDPDVYEALMALKAVGNIGAHPERDVSLMIDVDVDEAKELLEFLHLLDQEWYVIPADRAKRLKKVVALEESKQAAREAFTAGVSPARQVEP